ncbi:cyclophilin-like fold protein [Hyphomicrobium sulfonivorans]|uniref:cyclophilin-like fold protein n=1 Tax=Hyphomicrobium sulfonivorans TaxID=121290 RepID=UPI000838E54C|nr:cyclophilin-like fold protein [Hyphomicrobium sulfonivorans]
MRVVIIRAGKVAIRARLLETPTAERIWAALPIHAEARMWGREIYFNSPVSSDREPEAREVVNAGEIAFWPDGEAIAIGFGPTPVSRRGEIRMASPCNIWAMALDDVSSLRTVYAGEGISVEDASASVAER